MLGRLAEGTGRAFEHTLKHAEAEAIPPGWSYNPSAWKERLLTLALAFVGLGLSFYLTLNQAALIPPVWDPIFGSASSEHVLHSVIEKYILIPDSSLGIVGYLADLVLGSLGGRARWRTLPWAVLAFGATMLALGMVSMILVIVQAVVVRHWCLLCLGSAVASTLVLGLGFGEVLATLQYLRRMVACGQRFWPAFWGPLLWTAASDLRGPRRPDTHLRW